MTVKCDFVCWRTLSHTLGLNKDSWYQEQWWRIQNPNENLGCSVEEMDEIIAGIFTVKYVDLAYSNKKTAEQYISSLSAHSREENPQSAFGFGYGAYAYDSIWTAALVMDTTDQILKEQG
ncbi:gamma-aminobutyric acid type B receptor subunit 1-like [Amphiura filiformis]|uniref:gamma-aminobutyric acid type B receptor subunit 1-like n=1 Tax=Amphiura filiformis TaxID=82378 RepID=UPI003B211D5E